MKKILHSSKILFALLLIFFSFINIACSEVSSSNNNSSKNINKQYSEFDMKKVKYMVYNLQLLDELSSINDGFYESVQSLNSLAIKGYELYGYSEGISSLELANKGYQNNLESYTNLKDVLGQLKDIDPIYTMDNSEIDEIVNILAKNIENYNETYNFTKQYISSNDSSYIEKFNSHEEIQYKNKLDIDNLILQKKAELYENILNYDSAK